LVILGDCLTGMAGMADNQFDLAIPDPPYFSGPERRSFYGSDISTLRVKRVYYPVTNKWEVPGFKWYEELCRVSKNQIIFGANYFDFIGVHKTPRGDEELQRWISEHPTGWIVWDKCARKSSFNDFELAWTSFDRPTVVFKFMWAGMMQGKSVSQGHIMQGNKKLNEKKFHPTQKPRPLYNWIFNTYCSSGESIFDPYVGSGSSRIEAYDAGLPFLGYEIEDIHFDAQEKRFQKHLAAPKLFNLAI